MVEKEIIPGEKPLVTVITVTYNSERFVRQAIESVLCQSYTSIEYLICDDCSSDNTWTIISGYADQRIRAIRNPSNLSEYVNRNQAIALAQGEYIIFLDGDDIMLYRGIEDAVREMERYPDCGFGVVRTGSLKFVGPLRVSSSDALNVQLFGGGLVDSSLTNSIFRTSLLQKQPFLIGYTNSDTFTRILLLEQTNVLVLFSLIGVWRLSNNQASAKIALEKSYREHLHFYRTRLLGVDSFLTPEQQGALKSIYYRILWRYVINRLQSPGTVAATLQEYRLDSWAQVLRYLQQPVSRGFWNEYNWMNINIDIHQKGAVNAVHGPERL